MTQAQISSQRRTLRRQLRAAVKVTTVVDCGGCGRSTALPWLYRCFECGVWYCASCGASHWPEAAAARAARVPTPNLSTPHGAP